MTPTTTGSKLPRHGGKLKFLPFSQETVYIRGKSAMNFRLQQLYCSRIEGLVVTLTKIFVIEPRVKNIVNFPYLCHSKITISHCLFD
jgi:hypothetical protein